MSTSVESLPAPSPGWVVPETTPLNEKAWEKWFVRTEVGARRGIAARLTEMTWLSIATLVTAAFVWPETSVFETVTKFIVTAGAIFLVAHFYNRRNYAIAVVSGALALRYNPVFPAFNFTGEWQRAVVAMSAAPFAASLSGLVSRDMETHHG